LIYLKNKQFTILLDKNLTMNLANYMPKEFLNAN